MAGIYLHIPFCKQACHYCDFHFSVNQDRRDQVIDAMILELEQRRQYLNHESVSTIYFGGGTPSILTKSELTRLLSAIRERFDLESELEITFECNPDDIDADSLNDWRDAGINRLSIGVQSFREIDLKLMNRAHSAAEADSCLEQVRQAGFDNYTLDLIYGIPDCDDTAWQSNIEAALAFNPPHISAYCLTIEPKTVFAHWKRKGKLTEVSPEAAASQFRILSSVLQAAGIEQYEVSNFAKPGFESLHNSAYWQGTPYLGVGPSAHSFDRLSRRWNVSNNIRYANSVVNGSKYWEDEVLTLEDRVNERIMTGLRTRQGLDLVDLQNTTSVDLLQREEALIDRLTKEGLAMLFDGSLRLTNEGLLQADRIASELFIIES
ncbi:MAG: radical SAM family heme chaperone HemW [Flavobacteriales bacterium]|nr:radical SAM family heme chaperone HemW [Flavobacteriales bacterium]